MDNKKVYRTKDVNKVAIFILCCIVFTVLFFFVLSSLLSLFPLDQDAAFVINLILSGGIGAVSAFFIARNAHPSILTLDEDRITLEKGKKVESFTYEQFRGTYVQRNYTNGIYTGSTRYLQYAAQNGNVRRMMIPLTKEEFSDIEVFIKNRIRGGAPVSEEEAEQLADKPAFEGEYNFAIPKEEFISKINSKKNLCVSVFSAIAAIALIALIVLFFLLDIWSFVAAAAILGAIAIIFAFLAVYMARGNYKKSAQNMPSFVRLNGYTLNIDGREIAPAAVNVITMTPGGYESIGKDGEFRTMVLDLRNGEKTVYYFGTTPKGDKKLVYQQYGELQKAVDYWCYVNGVDFRADLG